MSNIYTKLGEVQVKLNAPKSRYNSFGNYNYRSLEDILEAVKPLLIESGLSLWLTDSIELIQDRYYLKATATLTDGKETIQTSALARESLAKKGMDDSQITGTASSYARKYCLNGLFLIDDVKDADTDEHHQTVNQKPDEEKKWLSEGGDGVKSTTQEEFIKVEEAVKSGRIKAEQLRNHYKVSKATQDYFNKIGG